MDSKGESDGDATNATTEAVGELRMGHGGAGFDSPGQPAWRAFGVIPALQHKLHATDKGEERVHDTRSRAENVDESIS